jgi:FxLD family lantipeptide
VVDELSDLAEFALLETEGKKMSVAGLSDEFDLDVRVVTDLIADAAPCDTNDGCAGSCASACTSNA